MKCCMGKTSSMTPSPPTSPPLQPERRHTNARTHIHAPNSPLPQPASPPPPDPVIPSSSPQPPNSLLPHHLSAAVLQPSTCSLSSLHSCSFPAGRLSVDVKAGSVVSNSPSDTGLLTFHCTLRKEGFFSLLTGVTPHRP